MSILGSVFDTISDVVYETSLQPTIMDIKWQAKKMEWESNGRTKKGEKKKDSHKPKTKGAEKTEDVKSTKRKETKTSETKNPVKTETKSSDESKSTKRKETKTSETKNPVKTETVETPDNTVIDLEEARNKKLIEKGGKMVSAALTYMNNGIEIDGSNLTDEDKSVLNGIASIFNFGKIFEEANVADLRNYDSKFNNNVADQKYIFDINSIGEIKSTPLGKKISRNIEKLKNDVEDAIEIEDDDLDATHPINFTVVDEYEYNYEPVKGKGISNNLFKKLEKAFLPYLNGRKHQYTLIPDNGLIRLYYDNDRIPNGMLTIDPGLVMGCGKLYVMAKIPGDFVFVDTDHHDIISKLFENNMYELTDEEYQLVLSGLFRNTNHYTWIDLSNTSFMGKLSEEQFQKLGKKFTFVLSKIAEERPGMELPRLRITNWKSIDNFDMISDDKVISPLSREGDTKGLPELGLKVQVRKDAMIEYKNDQKVSEYTVAEYGVM